MDTANSVMFVKDRTMFPTVRTNAASGVSLEKRTPPPIVGLKAGSLGEPKPAHIQCRQTKLYHD